MTHYDLSPAQPDAARIADLVGQLRLPEGAASDPATAALLARLSDAALARIERLTGRVFGVRTLTIRMTQRCASIPLPVRPVASVERIEIVSADGARIAHEAAAWRVEDGAGGQVLVHRGEGPVPPIPPGGWTEARLTAGYGPAWQDSPADLREAVTLAAAAAFEDGAAGVDAAAALPRAVAALVEPFRQVRL